jgi:hypothetical protein
MIKATYEKPTVNTAKWGKTEIISSKISNKTGCPFSLLLFNIVLELGRAIGKRKE